MIRARWVLRKRLHKFRDAEIARPKILTPLGDAVRLVDGHERERRERGDLIDKPFFLCIIYNILKCIHLGAAEKKIRAHLYSEVQAKGMIDI